MLPLGISSSWPAASSCCAAVGEFSFLVGWTLEINFVTSELFVCLLSVQWTDPSGFSIILSARTSSFVHCQLLVFSVRLIYFVRKQMLSWHCTNWETATNCREKRRNCPLGAQLARVLSGGYSFGSFAMIDFLLIVRPGEQQQRADQFRPRRLLINNNERPRRRRRNRLACVTLCEPNQIVHL